MEDIISQMFIAILGSNTINLKTIYQRKIDIFGIFLLGSFVTEYF